MLSACRRVCLWHTDMACPLELFEELSRGHNSQTWSFETYAPAGWGLTGAVAGKQSPCGVAAAMLAPSPPVQVLPLRIRHICPADMACMHTWCVLGQSTTQAARASTNLASLLHRHLVSRRILRSPEA